MPVAGSGRPKTSPVWNHVTKKVMRVSVLSLSGMKTAKRVELELRERMLQISSNI